MFDFHHYIKSLELPQLQACQKALADEVLSRSSIVSDTFSHHSKVDISESYHIEDYTDYVENFFTNDLDRKILSSELESQAMGFKYSKRIESVQNRFISMYDQPYTWKSKDGPVINNPVPLEEFPMIKKLLDGINSKYNYNLNSVLVSYYVTGKVSVRLHDDDEPCMDNGQPLCILSLGAKRRIEWVDKQQESFRQPVKALYPSDGSLYTMKPGCQERFLHRVRKNKNIKEGRYCLSFRCFVKDHDKSPAPYNLFSGDLHSTPAVNRPPTSLEQSSDHAPSLQTPNITTPQQAAHITHVEENNSDNCKKSISFGDVSKTRNGYSPFPDADGATSQNTSKSIDGASKKLCVLFGTSITTRLNSDLLSRKNTIVINRSESGATIQDIYDSVNDFYSENSNHAHRVSKVLLSLGTNEVKTFNSFKYSIDKFYEPLVKLIKQIKLLFPLAQIVFQSLLPIRVVFKYTARSVHLFNELLIKVCGKYDCIFFDCFGLFLDDNGYDINQSLYWDKYHLNDYKGIKVLSRALKQAIYGNLFNPYAISNIRPYYT